MLRSEIKNNTVMIKDVVAKNEKETRAGFGEGIYELGKEK